MIIIKLKDSAIENIDTDMTCLSEGCETCGYGSDYCTEIAIKFSDNTYYHAEYHESYNYSDSFSIWYFVRLFCQNIQTIEAMTKDEFIDWIRYKLSNDFHNKVSFW